MSDKVRENRLRRAAARQGLVLRKSRRRDPQAIDFGQWFVNRPDGDLVKILDSPDEVEVYLYRAKAER